MGRQSALALHQDLKCSRAWHPTRRAEPLRDRLRSGCTWVYGDVAKMGFDAGHPLAPVWGFLAAPRQLHLAHLLDQYVH